MKNTIIKCFFKALCLTLISLTTLTVNAQPFANLSQEERETKTIDLINEANYVVEGKSPAFRYFYGDDGKTIFTEFTFEVSHWYKGKGEKTISIIRTGGAIGNDDQIDRHKGLGIGGLMTYVILLKKGVKKGTYEYVREIRPVIAGSNDKSLWGGFYGVGFESYEELNEFLSRAKGIKSSVKKKDVGLQKSFVSPH